MQSYGSLKEAEKGRRVGLRDVRRIQQLLGDFEDGKKDSRSWEQASVYSHQDNETLGLQLQENEF